MVWVAPRVRRLPQVSRAPQLGQGARVRGFPYHVEYSGHRHRTPPHARSPSMMSVDSAPATRGATLLLWLCASTVAALLALHGLSAAVIDGIYIPADHDSFYHARRILAALPAPWHLLQFDPRIHAPDGSWVTWPWAYDMLIATLAKGVLTLFPDLQALAVLDFIAPVAVIVSTALVIGCARQLRLPFALQVVATFSFALANLTRELHRVGMLDHHYVEHMFVLATVYGGLRWCNALTHQRAALGLGVILGLAPAFHNGDFILQLPVLVTLAVLWWRHALPRAAALHFAGALFTTTLLMLLPSQPFRLGMFSYTLHSWFHLYIAAASCLSVLWMRWRAPSRLNLLLGVALGLLALLPLVPQIGLGAGFLGAKLAVLDRIQEAVSIPEYLAQGDYALLAERYSALIWLAPLLLAALCWRLRHHYCHAGLHFTVMCVFGMALSLVQGRLAYFGGFVLWLAPCVLFAPLLRGRRQDLWLALFGLLMLAAHAPGLLAMQARLTPGGDISYQLLRGIYLDLGKRCARAPGVVLAEHDNGHYISFHSECSVIADNFILTPQHEQALVLVESLMAGTVDELLHKAPYVRYLLVQRADDPTRAQKSVCWPRCAANAGLRHELLEVVTPFPPRVRLLAEQLVVRDGRKEPLARLFEILPAAP